jgi:hypothetical protein
VVNRYGELGYRKDKAIYKKEEENMKKSAKKRGFGGVPHVIERGSVL